VYEFATSGELGITASGSLIVDGAFQGVYAIDFALTQISTTLGRILGQSPGARPSLSESLCSLLRGFTCGLFAYEGFPGLLAELRCSAVSRLFVSESPRSVVLAFAARALSCAPFVLYDEEPVDSVTSDRHVSVQLDHFIPGFLSYSVPVFLQ
jgi:hypothetical protein